jgi:SNF2 family DNA or RNA helicase
MTNDEYKKIINKTYDKEDNENIIIPENMDNILRSYQKTGYKWLKILDEYRFGGILADDMGLGKTLQIIAILSSYISGTKKEERKASLVVCPSSLSINWKSEVKKFAPNINVLVISGKAQERKDKIQALNEYDLVITSYDLLKRDIDIYNESGYIFRYVIADEAQYIKNSNTKNAITLKNINANTRFALTGTPIENSLSELWSIFDYIMPGYLFSYTKFKKNYESPIVKSSDEDAIKKLKMLIEPFILRRLKKEVLTELPDKTISVLNNEMVDEQNKIYVSYLMNAKKEIQDEISANGFEKSQIKILALLTRLRQICCHPSLFIGNYRGESSKLNQCMEIINDAIESNHRILLFSQFTSMFEIIEKELNKNEIKYYKLTGSTKVDERIKMVDEFNTDENIKVFLISLKAGGTGLNLTGADMVIHYDPWWNLSAENQATDRAYRIGQKNNVQVYKLITQNSIEEKINELQNKKARLSDDMLSTEETFINKLSKQDIMGLFE